MKTLYLHIGTPKTATSSIQTFCKINQEQFHNYNYSFPLFPFSYPGIHIARNAHFLVGATRRRKLTPEEKRFYHERLMAGLARIHEEFEHYDNVILTDESLWRAINYTKWNPVKKLSEDAAAAGYQMKVIVYLRRQDQFLISHWNQQVKRGERYETCAEHIEHVVTKTPLLTDYASTLDIISSDIGQENIIVRRFEPASWVEQSIYSDFLDAIGLMRNEDFVLPEDHVNVGLKENFVEIKRSINSLLTLSPKEKTYLGGFIKELSADTTDRPPCSMLSAGETRELLSRFEEGNARIAREYLHGETPLFPAQIKDSTKWQPDNVYMTEDIIRFFATLSIDQRRENIALSQEIAQLRKEMDILHKEIGNLQKKNEHLVCSIKKSNENFKTFKNKLKHPFRTLWNRFFKKGTKTT